MIQETRRIMRGPAERLPFSVRRSGHYLVTPPYNSPVREKQFVQLFWGIKGSGAIVLHNHRYIMKSGNVAVYLPGMRHEWGAVRGRWEFFWMSLEGALAESIAVSFGLYAELHKAGPAPRDLFQQLFRSMQRPARDSESRAASIAFRIMTRAAHRPSEPANPLISGVVELIHQNWRKPSFNVKTLAAEARVNRSSLSRRFYAAMGVSPTDYIQRLRLQHALALLRNTNRSASDIALQCGFSDAAYFSRWVRRVTGQPPGVWRRSGDDDDD